MVESYQPVITISYSECTINLKHVKHSPGYRNYGAAMNISQIKISLIPCQKSKCEDTQKSKCAVLLLLYLFPFKNCSSLAKEAFKRFSILNCNLNTQNYITLTTNRASFLLLFQFLLVIFTSMTLYQTCSRNTNIFFPVLCNET